MFDARGFFLSVIAMSNRNATRRLTLAEAAAQIAPESSMRELITTEVVTGKTLF
jgi:hypothetical protein